MRARAVAALAAGLAAGASGCGLGAARPAGGVSLTVTRDFGARIVGRASSDRAGPDTVMRFLQRSFPVRTRYGGGFVQSIRGLSGGVEGGRRIDWFYYVNGVESPRGPTATRLHPGDRVWWDRHDWGAAMSIPAVVGSFPEPFRSGTAGRRLPVTEECAPGASAACEEVARRLRAAGAPAGRAAPGTQTGAQTLRVLVGRWPQLRGDPAARRLEAGPASSGVFARPAADGTIQLLDERGAARRGLGPGGGLVAATRALGQQPTWLVTGRDAAGVQAAAQALTASTLDRRFAVALSAHARWALPLPAGDGA